MMAWERLLWAFCLAGRTKGGQRAASDAPSHPLVRCRGALSVASLQNFGNLLLRVNLDLGGPINVDLPVRLFPDVQLGVRVLVVSQVAQPVDDLQGASRASAPSRQNSSRRGGRPPLVLPSAEA
jgi:hypothetical protein